jgi:chemotaxis protein MotB
MSAGRRRKERDDDGGGGWLASFGDMMTLLCTFFILIVSFSSVELIKFRKAMGALRGASGALIEEQGSAVAQIVQAMAAEDNILATDELDQTLKRVEETIFDLGIGYEISVNLTQEGICFRVASPIMFESGQATLKPEAYKLLTPIALLIRRFGYDIVIEGHTDNIPISSGRFPSNWELSAMRAISVLRYFTERHGVNPTNVMAVGYGEFRPIAPNNTPNDRALNRRVEILLKWPELSGEELLESRKRK